MGLAGESRARIAAVEGSGPVSVGRPDANRADGRVQVKKIYVGNLPWSASEDELRELFSTIGSVHSVAAITGREMDSRPLRVNEAQERQGRSAGGRW